MLSGTLPGDKSKCSSLSLIIRNWKMFCYQVAARKLYGREYMFIVSLTWLRAWYWKIYALVVFIFRSLNFNQMVEFQPLTLKNQMMSYQSWIWQQATRILVCWRYRNYLWVYMFA